METLFPYLVLLSPLIVLSVMIVWHYLECKAIDKRYAELEKLKNDVN